MYSDFDNQTRQRNDNESFLAAASAGAVDTVALLLDEHGVNINTVDRLRQTALFHAIQAGCEDCALYLLKRGIDWRRQNKRGLQALHLAAGMGLGVVVEWLLNASADPNARGGKHITALHVATTSAMTAMLLAAGADPDARDKDGETALFDAARCGRMDKMRLLIDAGADVDALNGKRETALFQAGQRGIIEVVDYLLGAGANPDLPGDSGRSLATVARRNPSLRTYMTGRAMRGCIDAALAEIARPV